MVVVAAGAVVAVLDKAQHLRASEACPYLAVDAASPSAVVVAAQVPHNRLVPAAAWEALS